MAPIPRLRDYRGPAILSYGFRPFFLLGALQAEFRVVIDEARCFAASRP